MYPIALEEQWKNQSWDNHAFQFLIVVAEINWNLSNADYYEEGTEDQIYFAVDW